MIKIIKTTDKAFKSSLKEILERGEQISTDVEDIVKDILKDVKKRGDKALREYTLKFDNYDIGTGKKSNFEVTKAELKRAYNSLSKKDRSILETAKERIEMFHVKQLENSWFDVDDMGITLGQKITPLERAGIYVPGGKAIYPSSVLMNAIPARVAGVKEIIMVTPPSKAGINKYVLAAAYIGGVDRVFKMGGAQSIAALTYGTKKVPKVDKIVGPGNIFVATAKKMVFGTVDIDMVAGPSEILIISDGTGVSKNIAIDLLSQAEHDELASSVLITTSAKQAKEVQKEVETELKKLKRKTIARLSIDSYGAVIVARTIEEAIKISNSIAPEHLEVITKEPMTLLGKITNAGAVFLGENTPEAIGDYLAGPNHTLPTGGTARFSSPLGTYDFIKRTSVINFSKEGIDTLGPQAKRFAEIEGLTAHAKSVEVRLSKKTKKK